MELFRYFLVNWLEPSSDNIFTPCPCKSNILGWGFFSINNEMAFGIILTQEIAMNWDLYIWMNWEDTWVLSSLRHLKYTPPKFDTCRGARPSCLETPWLWVFNLQTFFLCYIKVLGLYTLGSITLSLQMNKFNSPYKVATKHGVYILNVWFDSTNEPEWSFWIAFFGG